MSKPPYKRKLKNLIINRSFQIKYILWITSTGLGLVAVDTAVMYHYIKENYATLIDLSPMTDDTKTLLYSELHHFIFILIAFSIVFLFFVALIGLVFSHRTAGPLYHFKRVFEEIENGNLKQRVRLRPKDEFQDVAQSFNKMMDKIQK